MCGHWGKEKKILKENYKKSEMGRVDEEEDVSSYLNDPKEKRWC